MRPSLRMACKSLHSAITSRRAKKGMRQSVRYRPELLEHTSLNVNLIVTVAGVFARVLGIDPIKHSRKGNAFPDMFDSGEPAHGTLDTQSETTVGN